jgi:hypothetical protein
MTSLAYWYAELQFYHQHMPPVFWESSHAKKYSSRPKLSIIKITSVLCNQYILTNTIMRPKYYPSSIIIHLYVLAQYFGFPTLKFANNKSVDMSLLADHEIYPLV